MITWILLEGEDVTGSSRVIMTPSKPHNPLFAQLDTCGSQPDVIGYLDKELWSQLPHDLLPKILARLPFGSLFKISLLSKEWDANFRSPVFRKEVTAEISSTWESFSPVFCSEGLELVAFSRRANRWRKLFDLSEVLGEAHRSSSSWVTVDVAGSLMCLKEVGKPWQRRLIVANPLLKSCRPLPPRRAKTQFLPLFEIVHLICADSQAKGNDDLSSHYKVISISQDSSFRDASRAPPVINPGDQREHYEDNHLELTPIRVEIYDSTRGSWLESECGILMLTGLRQLSSVYLNGMVYLLLVSGWQEAYQIFTFNVKTGVWTTIPRPMPERASRLAQLVICGSSVLLVLFGVGPEVRRNTRFCRLFRDGCIAPGAISIFRIEQDFSVVLVSEGPDRSINSVDVVEGISGDDECIYLQVFGRPIVVVYEFKQNRWSTLPFLDAERFPTLAHELELTRKMSCRYFGSSFNWTSSFFQPGVNPFLVP